MGAEAETTVLVLAVAVAGFGAGPESLAEGMTGVEGAAAARGPDGAETTSLRLGVNPTLVLPSEARGPTWGDARSSAETPLGGSIRLGFEMVTTCDPPVSPSSN